MILYEEVLREFQRQKVKYVLAGGMAFNFLGGYRNTADMDILVEMTDKNLIKLVNILKKAGYHVKQPVDPILLADEKTRRDWIKNKHMNAFNFYKGNELNYEEIDILIAISVDYREAIKDALDVKAGGLTLKVISAKKLIKMKKAAGRDKDLMDVRELELLRNSK